MIRFATVRLPSDGWPLLGPGLCQLIVFYEHTVSDAITSQTKFQDTNTITHITTISSEFHQLIDRITPVMVEQSYRTCYVHLVHHIE
jgi:hypothetical protein